MAHDAGRPRIPPLAEAERDDSARELLGQVGGSVAADMHIFTTLVRHPRLFRRWLPFGGVLLSGALPARDRELLILRTAVHCDAAYEWAHHLPIGRDAGLTDAEIQRVRSGPAAPEWSDADSLLLRAADELHERSCLSDETWTALAARYDERQLIEVPMVVGHYHLVAYTLNSLGVQIEPGFEPGLEPG
ncbi:MAG: carboxymuconolactone decarboxylase family protein [Actinobacteria bacterium]|nr:carboxymuconolactone decarboxylase family protein [Actinomycetota bacterium]